MNKKMGIFFIFVIIILFIILFVFPDSVFVKDQPISEVTTKNSSEFPFKEYKGMIEDLLNKNYIFEYDIIIGNNKYDDIDDENIDNNLVNINYIYDLIKDMDYKLDTYNETRIYTYKTIYDNNDLDVIIYTNLKQVIKIVLSNQYYQYSITVN